MFRHSVAAFLLVAACSGSLYPRFEVVGRDPSQFDLLYSTTSGDHNETWYFTTQATVTAFIIPTQVDLSSGPGTIGTYMEDLELLIYHSYDDSEPSLEANGSYSGKVSMGQALHIPVVDVRTGGEFIVGFKDLHYYILNFRFKATGVYPWYQRRRFSTYSPVHTSTDVEGLVLGVAFSDD